MKEESKLTKRTSDIYKIALMSDFELQQKKTKQRNLSYLYKIELMSYFELQQKQNEHDLQTLRAKCCLLWEADQVQEIFKCCIKNPFFCINWSRLQKKLKTNFETFPAACSASCRPPLLAVNVKGVAATTRSVELCFFCMWNYVSYFISISILQFVIARFGFWSNQ